MMYYAITVFVVAYAFIISERFNQTKVALVGAGLMICLPVMDSPDVFYSQDNGIDWDVIFLMLGMMMIVSILRQTGVFEYVAIWSVKRANGSPVRIMLLLMLVMALASAVLPNVVSVLLIAPVTLLVCDALDINPVPMLMAEVFASNVGGAATLVGDPPNIIIGARKSLSFNALRIADVMSLQEGEVIRDRRLLVRCGLVMVVVFAGFILAPTIHIAPSLVALLGA